MKKALIIGVADQDGSFLFPENLLEKGYEVHGIIRRSSSFNTGRIDHIINDEQYKDQFFFYHGDVTKAKEILGWEEKTHFVDLVKNMVQPDWKKVKKRGY